MAEVGDIVTYTITVFNQGNADALDVVLVDQLPDFLDIISVAINPYTGQIVTIDNVAKLVTIEFGTLTPDDFFTITITTRVNGLGEPPGGTNTVILTTSSQDEDITNNEDGAITRIVEDDPDDFELPETGFAPNIITELSPQPPNRLYSDSGNLVLEIPALDVEMEIVGIPLTQDGWDVTWLWDNAGFLESTAFPTWPGNTGIAGHVTLPSGLPGPFVDIGQLQWGDQVLVHAWGLLYTYEIRAVEIVAPHDISVLGHEEFDWVTLITCKNYDEALDEYEERLVARAVLMSVEWDSSTQGTSYNAPESAILSADNFTFSDLRSSKT